MPTLLFVFDLHRRYGVELVALGLLVDLLPNLGRHRTPVLQLLWVQLIDAEVGMLILLLPLDGVKVGA